MRVALFLFCLIVGVDQLSAQPSRRGRRPRPTVPPPGPTVRDNSRPLPATPVASDVLPGTASADKQATEMPWPVGRPDWTSRGHALSLLPSTPIGPAPLPIDTVTPFRPPREAAVRVRWLAGAVAAPAPLIPRTGGIPPMFAPSFLALSGFEVGRRLRSGVWAVATGMGGYGRVDQTARLRGVRPQPGAQFAIGSGLFTAGVALQGPLGFLSPSLRLGGGMRWTLIDLPRDVWEVAPAIDVGAGVEVGRRRLAWVVDVRWLRSSFNAARLPVVRMPAAPIGAINETVISTGIRLRLGGTAAP